VLGVAGAAAGHTAGRAVAAHRDKQLHPQQPPEEKAAAEIQLTGHVERLPPTEEPGEPDGISPASSRARP